MTDIDESDLYNHKFIADDIFYNQCHICGELQNCSKHKSKEDLSKSALAQTLLDGFIKNFTHDFIGIKQYWVRHNGKKKVVHKLCFYDIKDVEIIEEI